MNPVLLTTVASAVCAALIGGVFYAFSVFVMRALAGMPPAQGVLAMQRINVTVIHPLFLGVFLGTAPLLGFATYLAGSGSTASTWLLASCGVYTLGSIGVTMLFNVPRNNCLASLHPSSPDAASYWPVYVREWLVWNHVRCIASLLAAALAIVSIAA